ncbi:MAG: dihydroorotate dehydrogenase electron transfer subunit [Thermoplasmata archaeon]
MYRMVNIQEKIKENRDVYSIIFRDDIKVKPGQFAMIWIPGVDEFPMSFSYIGNAKGFTFKVIGEGTKALSTLEVGERLFYRGPYGKFYTEKGEKALFIAGGTGVASLAPFIEDSNFKEKIVVIGAKTKDDLFFIDRLKNKSSVFTIFTEDGSLGIKGLATDSLKLYNFDSVYACGPEKMIRVIVDQIGNKEMQASLERYMKCGIGLCDSCAINGFRVCADGPVFNKNDLILMKDLGRNYRTPSGKISSY